MFSLLSLFARKNRKPAAAPSGRSQTRFRPLLECLEERTLLNARFVVPIGIADNVSNFATLQSALSTTGLNTGDTITILSGSTPGDVTTDPGLATLTIQGDPNNNLSAIPQFTVSSALTVTGSLTLRNVNVALVGAGALTFSGNSSIINSTVVDSSSALAGITLSGSADILMGSRFVASNAAITSLVLVTPPVAGSGNQIDSNTFEVDTISGVGNGGDVISYDASAGATTVTDVVTNNKFIGAPGAGANGYNGIHVLPPAASADTLTGLTIRNNQMSDSDITHFVLGVWLDGPTQNTTVSQNSIFFTGTSSIGIDVRGAVGGSTTVVNAVISGNVLAESAGKGLLIVPPIDAPVLLNLNVEGNDFHYSQIGVQINGGGNGFVTGVDLGGGSQGSLGGNNFRSFTAPGSPTAAAIVVTTSALQGTIQAQRNIFATGATPTNVVSDPNPSLNLGSALTGNAGFVAALYDNLLGRAGDTTNPADAGGTIARLNAGVTTQAVVVTSVLRSTEALNFQVNNLYVTLLGRAADAGGLASFVTFLQRGGTLENVIVGLVTSAEYQGQNISNPAFVQSLYSKLLGRIGSAAEVSGWVSMLNGGLARSRVASAFLASQEFRGDVVQDLYSGSGAAANNPSTVVFQFAVLLKRTAPASAGEVNIWVNSSLDLLAIENVFLGSKEYFTNG